MIKITNIIEQKYYLGTKMNTSKGTERVNEEGAVEIKVDSVDYRSPAGHTDEDKPVKEKVVVTHVINDPDSKHPATAHANPGEAFTSQVDSSQLAPKKHDD